MCWFSSTAKCFLLLLSLGRVSADTAQPPPPRECWFGTSPLNFHPSWSFPSGVGMFPAPAEEMGTAPIRAHSAFKTGSHCLFC